MVSESECCTLLYQHLVDMGCDDRCISHCMECFQMNRMQELQAVLLRQWIVLSEDIHNRQQQLDCLDFLVHQIVKENTII